MKKIYDCFCFFNELDLLELRLNILDPYVDFFVISESNVTHTGVEKPFYFEENKERYSKFLHKIIHVKVMDTPNDFINLPLIENPFSFDEEQLQLIYNFIVTQDKCFNRTTQLHYGRDFYQKECIRRGLSMCHDDDIILSSDCDEIPNPEILRILKENYDGGLFTFGQTAYYYYINMLKEHNWKGTRMGSYKELKNYSYNKLRMDDNIIINNGGWHFSFMGGADKVKTKIESYSAQEMNNSHVINSISKNIEDGIDPFFRSKLTKVDIDSTYPEYLLNNIDKYKILIK